MQKKIVYYIEFDLKYKSPAQNKVIYTTSHKYRYDSSVGFNLLIRESTLT